MGWGEIIFFALAIVIVTVVALRSGVGKPFGRKHPRPFPQDDESSSSSVSPQTAEISPAATVGSDYYVPTSDELKGEIKEHIFDRQKREALQLSRELVTEYRRLVESGEAKDVCCVIANPLVADFTVMRLAEEILKYRGWSARNQGNGTAFFGPHSSNRRCSFTPIDLHPIAESDSFAELIESNVIAPRKALALRIAKELVDAYRLKLEIEKPTSPGITVTLAAAIDCSVFTEVENILAPRGWSVTHRDGSIYDLWPAEKRDRPYRGSGRIFI